MNCGHWLRVSAPLRSLNPEIFPGASDNSMEVSYLPNFSKESSIRSSGAVQSNFWYAARSDIPLETTIIVACPRRPFDFLVGHERGYPLRSLLRALRNQYEDVVVFSAVQAARLGEGCTAVGSAGVVGCI